MNRRQSSSRDPDLDRTGWRQTLAYRRNELQRRHQLVLDRVARSALRGGNIEQGVAELVAISQELDALTLITRRAERIEQEERHPWSTAPTS